MSSSSKSSSLSLSSCHHRHYCQSRQSHQNPPDHGDHPQPKHHRWNVSDRAGGLRLGRRRRWRGESQWAQQSSSSSTSSYSSSSSSYSSSASSSTLRGRHAPSPKRVWSRSLGADKGLITSSVLRTSPSSSWLSSLFWKTWQLRITHLILGGSDFVGEAAERREIDSTAEYLDLGDYNDSYDHDIGETLRWCLLFIVTCWCNTSTRASARAETWLVWVQGTLGIVDYCVIVLRVIE